MKFSRPGSFSTSRIINRPKQEDDELLEITVLAYFHSAPMISIRSAVADLGISKWVVERILRKHKMHPYSFGPVQHLLNHDHLARLNFCESMLIGMQEDGTFLSRVIWTDESKFDREGVVNHRNRHYWATDNPHMTQPRNFQEKFSLNVFCLLMCDQVRFHIYDSNLTCSGYVNILRTVVKPFANNLPDNISSTCWYQMDGAPAHSTILVYQQLDDMFSDRWMGRNGPWLWPPRSPDLTPCDFYLWGRIKTTVYATPIPSREALLERIASAFNGLDPGEIRRATTFGVRSRILECLNNSGGHFEQFR